MHAANTSSLKRVFNVVMDNTYTADDIFIMLEFLFYFVIVPFGDAIFC